MTLVFLDSDGKVKLRIISHTFIEVKLFGIETLKAIFLSIIQQGRGAPVHW
jgi:hypothetical protein